MIGLLCEVIAASFFCKKSKIKTGRKSKFLIVMNIANGVVCLAGSIILALNGFPMQDEEGYDLSYEIISVIVSISYFAHYIDKIYLLKFKTVQV